MTARRAGFGYALLAAAIVLLWQTLVVRYDYLGNWTALFYAGDRYPAPPELAAEKIYTVPRTAGYDGQFYHYIAHDPLLDRGFAKYVDNPRVRWRRILVPGLAWVFAAGQSRLIDASYFAVVLGWIFLGVYWLSRYCARCSLHPAWGMCFALVPAVLVSIDRMTVDVALAALCVAFAYYAVEGPPSWKLYPVLVLAPLARETGLLPLAAWCAWFLTRREWRRALLYATAALPWFAWAVFVQTRTAADPVVWGKWVPLYGIAMRSLHPLRHVVPGRWMYVAAAADYVAICGVWLALILAVAAVRKREWQPVETALAVFALATVFIARADMWAETYAFGRTLSPLLLWLGMLGARDRRPLFLAPALLVLPRILLQFAVLLPAIVAGLLGR